jgi:hypothetical protein
VACTEMDVGRVQQSEHSGGAMPPVSSRDEAG